MLLDRSDGDSVLHLSLNLEVLVHGLHSLQSLGEEGQNDNLLVGWVTANHSQRYQVDGGIEVRVAEESDLSLGEG